MGAVHFLDDQFLLADARDDAVEHELELFETGGKRYLRIWVGGIGNGPEILCEITEEQARQLSEAAESLADRIS
ncbi:hypothetical protein AWB61_03075 [Chromobacterium sp. F49]|nr:hypothetical protein Cv017_01530 [Chromobacterium subtsugae]KZE84976.1 hypothetical protein AWB61_03075 [Chromobacterium sp. F49]